MTAMQTPTAHATLSHVALDTISIDENFNPRTSMDDAKLAEITASVRRVGVIQPIIVTSNGKADRYLLVAGHRRVKAARSAQHATIPALVYDQIDEATRLQLATIENLQREDINPIDEAAGYERAIKEFSLTQKQLADMVAKSASHISERLKLCKLPTECKLHIASGKLSLSAVKQLVLIAKQAPAVADGCARLVATGEAELDDLINEPHYVVGMLTDVEWDDAPFAQPVRTYSAGPIRFRHHIDEADVVAMNARAEALGFTRFSFDNEDLDAARAYKCLLTIEGQYNAHCFITDARFAYDRLVQALDRTEAAQTAQIGAQAPHSASDADTSSSPAQDGDNALVRAHRLAERRQAKEQAARAKERADKAKARLNAISANRQLGINLVKKLAAKKVDCDTARLLALMVLSQNRELAGRGIRYTHEEYHVLEHLRQKNGKTRTNFTPIEAHKAHEKVVAWVTRPKQPEEIIGRLLQAVVAGTFADEGAVAKSQHVHWHAPGAHGSHGARDIPGLIVKIGGKLLPEHFQIAAQAMLPTPTRTSKPGAPNATNDAKDEASNAV